MDGDSTGDDTSTSNTTGTCTASGAAAASDNYFLRQALTKFRNDGAKNPTELTIFGGVLNRAHVRRLIAFLRTGVNICGRPVHKLRLCNHQFDDESHLLLRDFLANNDSPETLKCIELSDGQWRRDVHVLETILSSFRTNRTVNELRFYVYEQGADGGADGGMVVGNLQQSHCLTGFKLSFSTVDSDFIPFVRAMRQALLANPGLQSLGFDFCGIGDEVLYALRDIFDNIDQSNTALTALSVTLNALSITANQVGHGASWCNRLRRLIVSLPGLTKLNLSRTTLSQEGVSALFQTGPDSLMHRLQSLDLSSCRIENLGLDRMCASIIPGTAAPLVHLNLSHNRIQGLVGGESLARLLHRCGNLEILDLSHNGLGTSGAGALGRALANLHRLVSLKMTRCLAAVSAEAILTSCLRGCPRIKVMDLAENGLLPSSLIPLAAFLRQTGGCLEELHLHLNRLLFGPSENGTDLQGPFFDTLADHKRVQILDIRDCGSTGQTEELLMSVLSKNTMLLHVHHSFDQGRSLLAEYTRRNSLIPKIESMMKKLNAPHDQCETAVKKPAAGIPLSLWPVALDVCSPRVMQVGPTLLFQLTQKMNEANVFAHPVDLYRLEKGPAIIRIRRIQRWWRQHRPSVKAAFLVRNAMREHVASLRNAMREHVASLSRENALLREQNAFLNKENEYLYMAISVAGVALLWALYHFD